MAESKLLTREAFRSAVFARDAARCVVVENGARCHRPAVDAHHIVERRLWPDSGYYVDNGASVCEPHHLACEQTLVSCDDLREWCGIKKPLLPAHLYDGETYDKWGNPFLANGLRARGELFGDESVQRVLAPVLHLFTSRVKYPRTPHLPWSPGSTRDDRWIDANDLDELLRDDVVVTIKMDGENTTMYRDGIHARSASYTPHPSRDWVKTLHARIAHEIPEGWRICGENLYAKHAIEYTSLQSWFQVFSIWDGTRCLGWDETVAYCEMLGLVTVPVAIDTRSIFKPFLDGGKWTGSGEVQARLVALGAVLERTGWDGDPCEGYVVRTVHGFSLSSFKASVAKYVRANHVQSHGHWLRNAVVANGLRGEKR